MSETKTTKNSVDGTLKRVHTELLDSKSPKEEFIIMKIKQKYLKFDRGIPANVAKVSCHWIFSVCNIEGA